jgi:alkylated DNA repair dioxygenase AlkB
MKLLLPTAAALAGQDGPPGGPSPADPWPEGFAYREEVISADEERALAERFALLPLTTSGFRGLLGWRRVVSCGWRYDGTGRGTRPSGGLPRLLLPLRDRAAEIADVPVQSLQQVLVTEVPPGAALGWRRDRSRVEDVIAVSFLAPCTLRLRRPDEHGWEHRSLEVMPRSAYLLRGPSRRDWEHSTAPVGELRFVVTFAISP